jgi:CDP-diacylglycerol--glycerol-3-phosphate 3-phosphatidyltransferase
MSAGIYSLKPAFVRSLRKVEDILVARNVSADVLTFAAIPVSLAAGACIAAGGLLEEPLWWLPVPFLCLTRLALNALDGSVARRTGTARPLGLVFNEVADRGSDALMIGATAFVATPVLAAAAVAATFTTSIAALLSVHLVGERDASGPMGKADRVMVLAFASLLALALTSDEPFIVADIVILVGAPATAVLRIVRLVKAVG